MNIEVKISNKPIPYKKALNTLESRVEELKGIKNELIWILEHPITFTAGIRAKSKKYWTKIKIIKTNRGGKITLHALPKNNLYSYKP